MHFNLRIKIKPLVLRRYNVGNVTFNDENRFRNCFFLGHFLSYKVK